MFKVTTPKAVICAAQLDARRSTLVCVRDVQRATMQRWHKQQPSAGLGT